MRCNKTKSQLQSFVIRLISAVLEFFAVGTLSARCVRRMPVKTQTEKKAWLLEEMIGQPWVPMGP